MSDAGDVRLRQPLLLGGSWGPERVPPRPDPERSDWHLPLHLRDQAAARERIAEQVAAGADVVVAPTWLTHRRALLPLGETRRAAAWTETAVRIAREGVELGLERREARSAELHEARSAELHAARSAELHGARSAQLQDDIVHPEDDISPGPPVPLVAAALPALEEPVDRESGRLLPPEAATERDYHDQAGILADADPDLVLVEGQRSATEARLAMSAAREAGLPVWAALEPRLVLADGVEPWTDWARHLELACLLLPLAVDVTQLLAIDLAWGVHAARSQAFTVALPERLSAGAQVVALPDGATGAALEAARAAIDAHERPALEAARAVRRRWHRLVAEAAAMAPGGAAMWLGARPWSALPEGFAWQVVDAAEARRLPDDHLRLLVVADEPADPGRLSGALERGGILVLRLGPGGSSLGAALADDPRVRLLRLDEAADPGVAVYRREE